MPQLVGDFALSTLALDLRAAARVAMKRPGFSLAGMAAALALTRLITGLLYQVEPTDAATFVAVGVLLLVVAVLAGYLPARRAAAVDPVVALRS